MPYINIPLLCPCNMVDVNRSLPANYHWKHFDEWTSWEQQTQWNRWHPKAQKVQRNDIFYFQIESDYSPIKARVRNSRGLVVLQEVAALAIIVGGKYYYQFQIAWDTIDTPPGFYLLEIFGGDPILQVLQSEVLDVREEHEDTILFRYSNSFNNNIIWETGISITMRISGAVPYDAPASVRTVYKDQPLSVQTVKGDAARKFKLYIGCDGGDPDYFIDKIDEILDQDNVEIDGKGFSALPGADWSSKKSERYPYAQWSIDLGETNNRRIKHFTTDGLAVQKFALDVVIETKLFGPLSGNSANDNTATITFID